MPQVLLTSPCSSSPGALGDPPQLVRFIMIRLGILLPFGLGPFPSGSYRNSSLMAVRVDARCTLVLARTPSHLEKYKSTRFHVANEKHSSCPCLPRTGLLPNQPTAIPTHLFFDRVIFIPRNRCNHHQRYWRAATYSRNRNDHWCHNNTIRSENWRFFSKKRQVQHRRPK